MVLKTYSCKKCGNERDIVCSTESSDTRMKCLVCNQKTAHFVVLNCKSPRFYCQDVPTTEHIRNGIRLTGVGADVGSDPAKEGVGKNPSKNGAGKDLAAKFNNSDRRSERREYEYWKSDKKKGKGRIYVGA